MNDNVTVLQGPSDQENYEQHWQGVYLEAHAISHVGRKRARNEDACVVSSPAQVDGVESAPILFAVADGMGGAKGGARASRLALDTIVDSYYNFTSTGNSNIPEALRSAVEEANGRVFAEADENPQFEGMGTTASAVLVTGEYAYVAQVGDSRVYMVRANGELRQITNDHSMVAEQVRHGFISEEEARNHSLRNLITRAVGARPGVKVDLFVVHLGYGDSLLICSDGLSNLVPEDHIADTLRNLAPDQAAHSLVDEALAKGAPDNVTAVTIRVTQTPPKARLDRGAIRVDIESPGLIERLRHLLSARNSD